MIDEETPEDEALVDHVEERVPDGDYYGPVDPGEHDVEWWVE